MNFDHIFNWKLLSGSHDFPGPDGGTCINEAAIVAAGFEYKKVISAADCPPCISRPIAGFAIQLNDNMPDDLRQKLLMPFVTRLVGSADTPEIEMQRAEFILIGLVRDVVSIPLRGWKEDLADKFGAISSLDESQKACEALGRARARARDLALALDLALDAKIFEAATRVLDGALKIGKQAEPIETAVVEARMESIKQLVKA